MQIVNGYACQTCTDVANAKRFLDPATVGPGGVPDYLKAQKSAKAIETGFPSVEVPGFALDAARRGVNTPLEGGFRGRTLNTLA